MMEMTNYDKEIKAFEQSMQETLENIRTKYNDQQLALQTNTPQYFLRMDEDWVAHAHSNGYKGDLNKSYVKSVARLPKTLFQCDSKQLLPLHDHVCGWLKKRGDVNPSFKRRYMELNHNILSYYKTLPEGQTLSESDKINYRKGYVNLDFVSAIKPSKHEAYGIDLVMISTPRTYVLVAENEQDYDKWINALCQCIRFQRVSAVFRRRIQLQEVKSLSKNELRVIIATTYSVGEAIEHIFSQYNLATNAVPLNPYDPHEFILKITGFKDYMLDWKRPIAEYQHVRECFIARKTLRLTVIHKSDVNICTVNFGLVKDLNFHSKTSCNLHPSTTARKDLSANSDTSGDTETLTSLESVTESTDTESDSPNTSIASSDRVDVIVKDPLQISKPEFKSGQVESPLRICIDRIANVLTYTHHAQKCGHEVKIQKRPLLYYSVIVRVQLVDGGEVVEGSTVETDPIRMKVQVGGNLCVDWDQPIWFPLALMPCEMSKSIRIVFTVFGVHPTYRTGMNAAGKLEKIATTGLNVFDVDGLMIQGDRYIQLFDNMQSFYVEPVPFGLSFNQPTIHIQCCSKPFSPIFFDWNVTSPTRRTEYRFSTLLSNKSCQVDKNGYLNKLSVTSFKRWKKQFVTLDHGRKLLAFRPQGYILTSHNASSNPIHSAPHQKQDGNSIVISLENAHVKYANDYNTIYTVYPVNKGTRKEYQTYCFQIEYFVTSNATNQCSNVRTTNATTTTTFITSNRKTLVKKKCVILSASTKQDRDDWMHSINYVANGENVAIFQDMDSLHRGSFNDYLIQSAATNTSKLLLGTTNVNGNAENTMALIQRHNTEIGSLDEDEVDQHNTRLSLPLHFSFIKNCSFLRQSMSKPIEFSHSMLSESSSLSMSSYIPNDTTNDNSSGPKHTLFDIIQIIALDPLYKLNSFQKNVLYKHRSYLKTSFFFILPRLLSCINWHDRIECREILALLPEWSESVHPAAYLALLDGEFANEDLRIYAVDKLARMADTTFSFFLPQLVQAIKYESHHASYLVNHVIYRGIQNPNQIGFDLFWQFQVETYDVRYHERYQILLKTFTDKMSCLKMQSILNIQNSLFALNGTFHTICEKIKLIENGNKKMKNFHKKKNLNTELRLMLTELNKNLPYSYQLPIDSRVEVGKLIVAKCRVMKSAKLPLWLVFENSDSGGDPITVIFKAGDDVRQDRLSLELIRLMGEMWRDEGLDLAMEPYKCVATSPNTGVIQVVPESITTADIHQRHGMFGALKDSSFLDWIIEHNQDKTSLKSAIDIFTRSCAGYCVATHVLGIGDRHNDNIMMATNGRFFHIDFGHFLGHYKYQMNMKRETTSFVFTKEMAYVMGGIESLTFQTFIETCGRAFNIVRRHAHLLISLLLLMVPAGMPELKDRYDLNHVVQSLKMELSEQEAHEYFTKQIYSSLKNSFKRFDNTFHNFVHKFK